MRKDRVHRAARISCTCLALVRDHLYRRSPELLCSRACCGCMHASTAPNSATAHLFCTWWPEPWALTRRVLSSKGSLQAVGGHTGQQRRNARKAWNVPGLPLPVGVTGISELGEATARALARRVATRKVTPIYASVVTAAAGMQLRLCLGSVSDELRRRRVGLGGSHVPATHRRICRGCCERTPADRWTWFGRRCGE